MNSTSQCKFREIQSRETGSLSCCTVRGGGGGGGVIDVKCAAVTAALVYIAVTQIARRTRARNTRDTIRADPMRCRFRSRSDRTRRAVLWRRRFSEVVWYLDTMHCQAELRVASSAQLKAVRRRYKTFMIDEILSKETCDYFEKLSIYSVCPSLIVRPKPLHSCSGKRQALSFTLGFFPQCVLILNGPLT